MCWRRHGDGSRDTVIVGQINVRSLKSKIPDMRSDISDVYGFDVLAICETWLSPKVPSRLLAISGYRLYRSDRRNDRGLARGHGGVALLVRDAYRVEVLPTPITGVQGSNIEVICGKSVRRKPPRPTVRQCLPSA